MKQVHKRVLALALVCLLFVAKSHAYNFESNGFYFNYVSKEDRTVEVTNDTFNCYSGNLTIPKKVSYDNKTYTVTRIGNGAFSGCEGLTSVTIPNSVTTIGNSAFYLCYGLTSVTIGNSVTTIGSSAFSGCKGLTSVTIPNSVTTIGNEAFYGCEGLTSVTIPNSVTTIGVNPFARCKLTSLGIDDTNSYFVEDGYVLYSKDKTRLIGCFNKDEVKEVNIPNSVITIGGSAFSYCSGLTSVTIPNSVTTIGDSAFYGCSGLTSVTIPNSVTTIGKHAFSGCSGLTSVTIPNSVTTIGKHAFFYCKELTSVTIGNSVTTIGNQAFYLCYGLEYIDCMAAVPPTAEESSWNGSYSRAILYVPKGSLDAYETTWPWSNFYEIMEKEFSGIDDVEADAAEVTVSADGGCIRVSGVAEGTGIEVYDMAGRRVYAGVEPSIEGLLSGAYVVRVAGRPYKVMVR